MKTVKIPVWVVVVAAILFCAGLAYLFYPRHHSDDLKASERQRDTIAKQKTEATNKRDAAVKQPQSAADTLAKNSTEIIKSLPTDEIPQNTYSADTSGAYAVEFVRSFRADK